ncbi:MAG: hypothetical protein JWN73_1441 [Betaproteobacteria bacterium]|nr:hypothetical protein [Betaproteobacteria bacterium]
MKLHGRTALALICAACITPLAHAADCAALAKQAEAEAPAFSPPSSYIVGGAGRLYFHTAPGPACRDNNVFVIPNDRLAGYAEFHGYISVMYLNPGSLKSYLGWVEAKRLQYQGSLAPYAPPK